jgi:(p)ppGpp synthase/HD superfamily hydrolase
MKKRLVENIIDISKNYSRRKHNGFFRKNDTPYYEHSFRVGDMVSELTVDEDVMVAAYLHDIFEHGSGDEKEILELFNERVLDLVKEITNDSELVKLKGKFNYLSDKLNSLSNEGLLIKLCDRYDNLVDTGINPLYVIETDRLIKTIDRPLTMSHEFVIELINSVISN